MVRKFSFFLACLLPLILLMSCGEEKRPFEAQYLSPNEVIITYQGKRYPLNRFTLTRNLPFTYSFESDGDLNLTLNGKEYDIDSPYDRDKKKKKVVKKKKKKSTTKKKK